MMSSSMAMKVILGVVAADLSVNGPQPKDFRSHVALAISVAAIAMPATSTSAFSWEIIIAELVWLIVLILHVLETRSKTSSSSSSSSTSLITHPGGKKSNEEETDDEDAVPKPIWAALEKAEKKFMANLQSDKNCDGESWKLEADKPNIKIYSSTFPGQSFRWWKLESVVDGSLDQIYDQNFNWENRLKWDVAFVEGRVIKKFTGIEGKAFAVNLSTYTSAPAGGGAISSRDFVAIGQFKKNDDGSAHFISISVDDALKSVLKDLIPPEKSGIVRGFGCHGGGAMFIPISGSQNKFRFTLISAINLNGWLFPSLVNPAMTSVLFESTSVMRKHMAKIAGLAQPSSVSEA